MTIAVCRRKAASDLLVQVPTKFELVINRKTSRHAVGSKLARGVLFSFRSSTNLHDVLAREDVLCSGASVEGNHHGNQEEETEEIG